MNSYHRSQRGKHRGEWVKCSAQKKCQYLDTSAHISEQVYHILKSSNQLNAPMDDVRFIEQTLAAVNSKLLSPKTVTAYRETSTIIGVHGHSYKALLEMSSEEYYEYVRKNINPDMRKGEKEALQACSWGAGYMPEKIRQTILANHRLGRKIRGYYFHTLKAEKLPEPVRWCGDDTTLAPADILIGEDRWSLKENSKIIKNSSIATIMSVLTPHSYGRGQNPFTLNGSEQYMITLRGTTKLFNESHPEDKILVPSTESDWAGLPRTERKRLANWINEEKRNRTKNWVAIRELKMQLNKSTGEYILSEIQKAKADGYPVKAGELLGGDTDYYYGALVNTKNGPKYIRTFVPKASTLNKLIKLDDVTIGTNDKEQEQLNLMLHLSNQRGETLSIQSEIRYSHGQFVTNPEVKSKIFDGDLLQFLSPSGSKESR